MKLVKGIKRMSLVIVSSLCFSLIISAQEPTPSPTPKQRERVSKNSPTENPKTDGKPSETPPETKPTVEPTQTEPVANNTTDKKDDPKQSQETAEDIDMKNAIVPFYDSYLSSYPLGPTDVISVEVFGQPN